MEFNKTFTHWKLDNLSIKQDTAPLPPLIVSIAKSYLTNCTANLTANASNAACNISYYWSNNLNSSHPTTQTINVASNVTATYWVIVNDGCRSDTDTIVITAPVIPSVSISSPATSICPGGSVLLTASPNSSSYNYQWYNGSSAISGATAYTYTATGAGTYTVDLIDPTTYCFLTSNAITISLYSAPAITSQPQNDTVCAGSGVNATFSVTASGTGLTYQWQVNSGSGYTNISGATGSTLTVSSVTSAMSGDLYRCVVSGTCTPSVTSSAALLTVYTAPSVLTNTGNVSVCPGTSVSFSITVGGTPTPSVQWQLSTNLGASWSAISGATATTYGFTATSSQNHYEYRAVLTNICGTATSSTDTLTVYAVPPAMITSTIGTAAIDTICPTQGDTLYANTGTGLTYQWQYLSGTSWLNVPGGTGSSLVAGGATYRVIVANANNCADTSAAKSVYIYSSLCACTVFTTYQSFSLLNAGSYSSASFTAGHSYYVNGNITLTGNVTLNNVYMLMADNVSIALDTAAKVLIDSSHLWACDSFGMWRGIIMNRGVAHNATLTIARNTLIEDADTAVEIPGLANAADTFLSDGVIYNRNHFGVKIDTFNTSTAAKYPFTIRNSIFTSRDKIVSPYYNWLPTSALKAYTSFPSYLFAAPFQLNDASSHHKLPCHDGNPAFSGICLRYVGYTSGSPNTYHEIAIGDGSLATGSLYLNLIDTMQYGIIAYSSNLNLQNTVIMNSGIDGIFGGSDNQGASNTGFKGRMRLTVPAGSGYNDQFWNCKRAAVELNYYYDVLGRNTKMVGPFDSARADTSWGYKIQNCYYDSADLQHDSLYNLAKAIDVRSWGLTLPGTPVPTAWMNLNNNIISPSYNGGNGNTDIGIAVNVTLKTSANVYAGEIHTDSNTIEAQSGILINNASLQQAYSNSNIIVLDDTYTGLPQYGISHTGCSYNTIYNDSVRGWSSSGITVMGDSCRGIYQAASTFAYVHCNSEADLGRGYEFFGKAAQVGTLWMGNSMKNNKKGFMLNLSRIGNQGSVGQQMNNKWLPNSSGWSLTKLQTFVYNPYNTPGYSASGSEFFVAGSSSSPSYTYPIFNLSIILGSQYGILNSLATGGGTVPYCPSRPGHPTPMMVAAAEAVAADSAGLGSTDPVGAWLSDYQLYKHLVSDSELVDSSAMLQDFLTLAASSRYGYLNNIEKDLTRAYYNAAQCKINNTSLQAATGTAYGSTGAVVYDGTEGDSIVFTSLSFFQLFKNFAQDSLSGSDSAQITYIAYLCPNVYGPAVYEARSLFTMVWDQPQAWDDDINCGYFYTDRELIRFGTDGIKKEDRNINTLPHNTKCAYCFLNIEVSLGKFITLGIQINSQKGKRIVPFVITKEPDLNLTMEQLVIGKEEIIFSEHFLDGNILHDIKDLSNYLYNTMKLRLNFFKNKDEIQNYYRFLYEKNITPLNLTIEKNLKAFAKVIQSFSKAKSLNLSGNQASKNLKEFLFEDSDDDIIFNYNKEKFELEKILKDYQSLNMGIKSWSEKQQRLRRLIDLKNSHLSLFKTFKSAEIRESYHYLTQLAQNEDCGKRELEIQQTKLNKLRNILNKLPHLEASVRKECDEADRRKQLFADYKILVDKIEELNEQITELLMLVIPRIEEDWKGGVGKVDISIRTNADIKKSISFAEPFLKKYKTLKSVLQSRTDQIGVVEGLRSSLSAEKSKKETLVRLLQNEGEESLLHWYIHNLPDLDTEALQAALYFAAVPIIASKSPENHSRYVNPEELFNGLQTISMKDGIWIKLGAIFEFVKVNTDASLLANKGNLSNSVLLLINKLKTEIEKMESRLQALRAITDGNGYDVSLFEMPFDPALSENGNINQLKTAVASILQIEEKVSSMQVEKYKYDEALKAIKLQFRIAYDEPDVVKRELDRNCRIWNGRKEKFYEKKGDINTQVKSLDKEAERTSNELNIVIKNLTAQQNLFDSLNKAYYDTFQENLTDFSTLIANASECHVEANKAFEAYKSNYLAISYSFEETSNGKNPAVQMEIDNQTFSFRVLEEALLGGKVKATDDIATILQEANQERSKIADGIRDSMIKIFGKTSERYQRYKTQIQRINTFFIDRKISGKFYFKLDFKDNPDISISYVEEIAYQIRTSATNGELQFGQPITEFIEDFFRSKARIKEDIPIEKLLAPRTYFELSAKLTDKFGDEVPGSTGETYSAIALLGIARLSAVQKEERKGLRFIILEELGSLDTTNFNTFPAIAEEFKYQIITMAPHTFNIGLSEEWYAHHLIKGNGDEKINYHPSASYFKTKEYNEDLNTYLNKISE